MAGDALMASESAGALAVDDIAPLPVALRRRVIRGWLLDCGATDLSDRQLRRIDDLVTSWRGQGGVAVGCARLNTRLFAERRGRRLVVRFEPVRLS